MPPYRGDQGPPGEGRGQKRRRDDVYSDIEPETSVVTAIIRVGDVSEAIFPPYSFPGNAQSTSL